MRSFLVLGWGIGVGAALALGVPSAGVAQAPPAGEEPDTIPLVFERELFSYPDFDRRNPFEPLTGETAGPRFEDLRLLGVILSSDPQRSVALMGTGGGDAGGSFRTRTGDVIGNVRVLEIQEDQVIVEVEEFGERDRRSLDLQRPERPAPQELFRSRDEEDEEEPSTDPDQEVEPEVPDPEDSPPGGDPEDGESSGISVTVEGGRK